MTHKILIVEDEDEMRQSLAQALKIGGFDVFLASECDEAFNVACESVPDLIICDLHLKGSDGRSLLSLVRRENRLRTCQFVFITGDRNAELGRKLMNLGADDYLEKPFTVSALIDCVNSRIDRLKAANRLDERLVAELRGLASRVLPHEFLTPLNGIIGLSDVLLLEGNNAADWQETVRQIRECGDRLHRSIRNYLAILSFADGDQRVCRSFGNYSPSVILEKCRSRANEVAERHSRRGDLDISVLSHGEYPAQLNLDWFSWVVEELVDNAFKFSNEGMPVAVRLKVEQSQFSLTVTDSGRGLSPDQLRQIGVFRQFDRAAYEQQGLGLGLTLVQHILEYQNGVFDIQSIQDIGTTTKAIWRPNVEELASPIEGASVSAVGAN